MPTLIERLKNEEMYVDAIDEAIDYIEDLELRLKSLGEMHDTLIGEYNRRGELIEKKDEALRKIINIYEEVGPYRQPALEEAAEIAQRALALSEDRKEK